ncbi:MAG: hypothetical protein KF708_07810 [Pirellulales bacterium]|nr:hypothetical protein [Pirellulales bacterium]
MMANQATATELRELVFEIDPERSYLTYSGYAFEQVTTLYPGSLTANVSGQLYGFHQRESTSVIAYFDSHLTRWATLQVDDPKPIPIEPWQQYQASFVGGANWGPFAFDVTQVELHSYRTYATYDLIDVEPNTDFVFNLAGETVDLRGYKTNELGFSAFGSGTLAWTTEQISWRYDLVGNVATITIPLPMDSEGWSGQLVATTLLVSEPSTALLAGFATSCLALARIARSRRLCKAAESHYESAVT